MSKFIQGLAAKRANLCRQRKAIEDAYLEQLESINAQIQRLDAAIDTMNEAIQPFICPACHEAYACFVCVSVSILPL